MQLHGMKVKFISPFFNTWNTESVNGLGFKEMIPSVYYSNSWVGSDVVPSIPGWRDGKFENTTPGV